MDKKEIVRVIGNSIISLGSKSVQKSLVFGMYEPEIPDVLKNQKQNCEVILKSNSKK